MSCVGISMVTMGFSVDPLNERFDYQLADSRGDIGVIYAYGLVRVFIFLSPVQISRCS